MSKLDYYQVLGISKDSSDQEIKKAYKRLAIKFHPDHNQGDIKSEEKFKEVKEAYEILIDPKKRSIYDKYGYYESDTSSGYSKDRYNNNFYSKSESSFNDIFSDIFSDIFNDNRKNSTYKGSDININLDIDLEDSFFGSSKDIKINILDKCDLCNGSGSKYGKNSICSSCEGKGKIQIKQGFFIIQQTCNRCKGEGKIIKDPCNRCFGEGRVKKNKLFSINIPLGINTGEYIKICNEGNIGKNLNKGDIYINVKIKSHSIFNRNDDNLHCEIPINFSISALGGEVEVPTLNGKIKLKIPSETQTGKTFRIKNKGIKNYKNNNIGDLLCKVIVETPVKLNDKQKFLLKELGNTFIGPNGDKNTPKCKTFFDNVKKFFNNLT
ncbi:chaperone protein DnaJ [endosymbiont of Sipalinus gigas]|uniref:molecular chaperone DnaJ n=1 Tax=endosymbiont of Sipalinus gigas TaxID=1972134 RepID=UPI000DC6DBCA|nr:molecular chaperone DnaJ [endosymbiont of Sipalinus gigas]BBA85281.1 chaperone protein DnaJ [endosymbiont of Sipalinus gigas]